MRLYRTSKGPVVERDERFFALAEPDWDALVNRDDLRAFLETSLIEGAEELTGFSLEGADLLPPIVSQEVWAAGVTYFRSRDARMEESKDAGGGDFYDRVYSADRPELFLKATPHRVVGPGADVRIRADSSWNVPEPELTLLVTSSGKIVGYTVGNDMSSRDIEGENPLYLPQAKVYGQSAALGPGILVTDRPLPRETSIHIRIERGGQTVFEGSTDLTQLKRDPAELVAYLFRENPFPAGCFLMTGTGVIPPNEFTLASGDVVEITIDGIGTLSNTVVQERPTAPQAE